MEFKEIQAKSILTPCGIPGIDYVINPYTGCSFGCTYCYASFMSRFLKDKSIKDWGTFVYAKVNAPELLKKELPRLKSKGRGLEIFMSSVTDPYQGVEAKYQLTRKCLEILRDYGFEGYVSILTKSNLVLRDLDVLKTLKNVVVGLTVTSSDDSVSRYFERYAPNVSDRFEALKTLNENGIRTYAFIGPLLPHFVAFENELESVFRKLDAVGTHDIFLEHLNLSKYIRTRLVAEMKDVEPEIIEKFYDSQSKEYREILDDRINALVKKYNMNLLTGGTIFHKEYQKSESRKAEPWKMENLPYRQGVSAYVVDDKNNFLLVRKQNYGEGQWDVPGGGLDEGELPAEGLLRELEEELGTIKFNILKESKVINRFEWPKESQDYAIKKYGVHWRGQEKYQFLVSFTGKKEEMVIQESEINKIKWVPYSRLESHMVFKNQWEIAKATLRDFGISDDRNP